MTVLDAGEMAAASRRIAGDIILYLGSQRRFLRLEPISFEEEPSPKT